MMLLYYYLSLVLVVICCEPVAFGQVAVDSSTGCLTYWWMYDPTYNSWEQHFGCDAVAANGDNYCMIPGYIGLTSYYWTKDFLDSNADNGDWSCLPSPWYSYFDSSSTTPSVFQARFVQSTTGQYICGANILGTNQIIETTRNRIWKTCTSQVDTPAPTASPEKGACDVDESLNVFSSTNCPSGSCIPAIAFLGRSVDIKKLELTGSTSKFQWNWSGYQTFDLGSKSVKVPSNMECYSVGGEPQESTRVTLSKRDAQNTFALEVGVEAGLAKEAGSANAKFGAYGSFYRGGSTALSRYVRDLTVFRCNVPNPSDTLLKTELRNAFATLPRSFSDDNRMSFVDFINKYGTHVVTSGEFGGRIEVVLESKECSLESSAGTDISASLTKAGRTYGTQFSFTNSEFSSSSFTTQEITVTGGSSMLICKSMDGEVPWATFDASSRNAPAMIKWEVLSISSFFRNKDQASTERADALDKAVLSYAKEAQPQEEDFGCDVKKTNSAASHSSGPVLQQILFSVILVSLIACFLI